MCGLKARQCSIGNHLHLRNGDGKMCGLKPPYPAGSCNDICLYM